jgi:MFS family permease
VIAGGRRAVVYVAVTFSLFVSAIDQTSVAVALNAIQRDLGTTIEWSAWVVTIYALGQVVMLPIAGGLAERFGHKRVLAIAMLVFSVASLACLFATDIRLLLVLRALQALGNGAFLPASTGIVTQYFGPGRDRALGLFSSVFWLGGSFGPLIGGLLVQYLTWRWIFLISAPLCFVLLLLVVIFVPKDREFIPGKLDLFGLVLLAGFLLSAMFGITLIGSPSSSVPVAVAWGALGLSIGLGVILGIWLRKAKNPFVPGFLVWGRGFRTMNLINFLTGISAVGFTLLIPVYSQDRFGFTALEVGTLLTGRAVGTISIAGVAAFALRRTGYRLPMYVGFGVASLGSIGIALVPPGVSPYVWLALAAGLCGIGQGIAFPAANTAITRLAPERAGSIAGLRSLFRQSGSIVLISLTTAAAAGAANPGGVLSVSFLAFAVLIAGGALAARAVPEHRGSW